MHPFNRPPIRVRQQGQTLIIALIVLGVLLVLGLVFLGLINRNIVNASRSQRRSESYDLAVAGVTYTHSQLVSSPLGADWRGVPTEFGTATVSGDPDAYYLRPKSGLTVRDPSDPTGTALVADLGGPDMLGPFIRIPFPGGRSLTRVRYGATDATATKLVPGGPLRNPGAARSTLIIESVGRTGVVNTNDPTTLNAAGGLQVNGFADADALAAGIAALAQADAQLPTSRRIVAYARIGIIDAARFETNVFNSSAPIELGIADGLGIHSFNDINPALPNDPSTDVGANLETQIGSPDAILSRPDRPSGFGSAIINGDVLIHGHLHVYANRTLGDTFRVAGRVSGADGATPASIAITPYKANAAGTAYTQDPIVTLTATGPSSFDSQSPNFNTAGGILLDGSPRTDNGGFASGVGTLVPPSTQTVDPQTRLNRYVALTRETGLASSGTSQQNAGAFGHGSGVYVDNAADRQEPADDKGRRIVGSQRSLFDDWLNPNSGAADSGWRGPFYIPVGAAVQLLPDGFTIQRDGAAATEKTWKNPDGTDSGRTTIRYRLGKVGNQVFIVDTLTPGVGDINGAGATGPDFTKGVPFNGVLYFEGNVRVRGTIPTSAQLTLVSGATIYIEGSITKGIVNNDLTTGGTRGDAISSLPTASLMLMAKDNVAVNTTMFFGPTSGQDPHSGNDSAGATNISDVRLSTNEGVGSGEDRLELNFDLALDPNTTATSSLVPSQWKPYAVTYRDWQGAAPVPTSLVLAETMDDGTGSSSFMAIDVNSGADPANPGFSKYPFSTQYDPANPNANGLWDNFITNTAATYLNIDPNVVPSTVYYGLGAEPWQRYAKFETRSFPIVPNPANAVYAANGGKLSQTGFNYTLFSSGNNLLVQPTAIGGVPSEALRIGRVAVTPSEVRIEASIFAEQGSFFVIPGPWFNPNPNDTHDAYAISLATNGKARADRIRLEAYGTGPGAPFYGEPLDVRLSIVGSVAENLPPPIAVQSEWIRKWGWIPRRLSATGIGIPGAHVPGSTAADKTTYASNHNFVPNLVIQYDPVLATGRVNDSGNPNLIRVDANERPLPPMPRLPVSPKLAYFGEIQ